MLRYSDCTLLPRGIGHSRYTRRRCSPYTRRAGTSRAGCMCFRRYRLCRLAQPASSTSHSLGCRPQPRGTGLPRRRLRGCCRRTSRSGTNHSACRRCHHCRPFRSPVQGWSRPLWRARRLPRSDTGSRRCRRRGCSRCKHRSSKSRPAYTHSRRCTSSHSPAPGWSTSPSPHCTYRSRDTGLAPCT